MMSTVTVLTWYLVYCSQVDNTKLLGKTQMGEIAASLLKEEKEERKVTEGIKKLSVREGWITMDADTAARIDKNPEVSSFAANV